MRKRIELCLAFLFYVGIVAAQVAHVSGRVVADESGDPIVGASVQLEGAGWGTITDADGLFRLDNIPEGVDKIVVSFIGMKTQEADIRPDMVVRLESDIQALDEVEIQVAYGTAKRTSLTGAISSVTAEEIAKRPVSSVTAALEGTATGIQVNNTYGQPGEGPSIRIRGFNTVNGRY